jgi:hypothetical protein
MSSNSRTAVSAELGLGLVGPEHTIVPLMASLDPRPRSDRGISALSRGDRGRQGLAISGIGAGPEDAEHLDDVPVRPRQFEASAAELTELLSQA